MSVEELITTKVTLIALSVFFISIFLEIYWSRLYSFVDQWPWAEY